MSFVKNRGAPEAPFMQQRVYCQLLRERQCIGSSYHITIALKKQRKCTLF